MMLSGTLNKHQKTVNISLMPAEGPQGPSLQCLSCLINMP